jgi:hypothetical protein
MMILDAQFENHRIDLFIPEVKVYDRILDEVDPEPAEIEGIYTGNQTAGQREWRVVA